MCEDFTCENCEEEYQTILRFKISGIIDGKNINEYSCPDCIGNLFIEDPEQVSVMKIIRCP